MGHAFAQLPIITSHPKSANIVYNNVGQTTTFSVSATNTNTFQWQYSIGGVNFEDLSESASYVGTQTATLRVLDLPASSGFFFRVKVGNVNGVVYSKLAILSLKIKFDFTYSATASTWVVPQGVTSIKVTIQGGSGGKGGDDSQPGAPGGASKQYEGNIMVVPGSILTIAPGQIGTNGFTGTSSGGGSGGKNALGFNGGKGGAKYAELAKQNNEKHIFALESDAGGFTPRAIGISATSPEQFKKFQQWANLLKPYGTEITAGGGGADIGPLKNVNASIVLAGLVPDSQRYFDLHHAKTDVFENVNKRELLLGAVNMAAVIYLIDQYGTNL